MKGVVGAGYIQEWKPSIIYRSQAHWALQKRKEYTINISAGVDLLCLNRVEVYFNFPLINKVRVYFPHIHFHPNFQIISKYVL